MFSNPHFDRLRQSFADQFEGDQTGFLYRKGMKDAPIRVTEAERDSFVSTFRRRLRYVYWSMIPATLLLIGLLVILVPDREGPLANFAVYVGIAAILVPFLLVYRWAWNAPARELERRPRVGEARTREEVQQIAFAKITYGQLALAVGPALLLVWKVSAEKDVLHGWGVLWLVFAGALIVGAAVQALRKWMSERD